MKEVRKFLAFFLTVCMMAAFVPAAFADEGSEGDKVDITISESGTEVVLSVDQQEVRKDGSINGVNIITDQDDNTLTTAVAVDTSGQEISKTVSNTGTVEATVNGDVNGSVGVMSDDPQTADTRNTEITLTVNGDITSEGNDKYGLRAGSYTEALEENTSNTNVTVNGNVSASGEQSPGVTTVTYANADKTTAETAVTVNGSVKSEDTGIEITSYSRGNGASANTSVTVGEDVAAKADGRSVQGVDIRTALTNPQATNVVNVKVDGEVSAEGASATGIQVTNDKADVTVTAGSVTATAGKEGKATAIDIYGGAKGAETQVTVNGDVVSSDVGVRMEANAGGGNVAVIIEGELRSANEALDVTTTEGADNTLIAVTAIKDENGEKVDNFDEKIKVNGSAEGEAVSNFAKGILYIVNKAGVGQNISVTGTKTLTPLASENQKTYDVAQEMDEIIMTADGDGTLEDVSAGDYAEVTITPRLPRLMPRHSKSLSSAAVTSC